MIKICFLTLFFLYKDKGILRRKTINNTYKYYNKIISTLSRSCKINIPILKHETNILSGYMHLNLIGIIFL